MGYNKKMEQYQIETYLTEEGNEPFQEWLNEIKDKIARTKISARLRRASYGNFGDWKDLKGAKGIYEMREHYGQGYRIFYSIINQKIVLLLVGSTKKDQNKMINKAKEYFADYNRRNK